MKSWHYLGFAFIFYIFLLLSLSDEDYNKSGEECEEFDDLNSSNVFLKKSNKLKKKGRKCQWSETLVNDLVDIVVEIDKCWEKLLMTNTKNTKNGQYMDCVVKELKERCADQGEVFPFDTNQTRQEICRCVVACRAATLKIKTSSGIKRFQELNDYGECFSKLVQYVATMDSCQRGEAIEPIAIKYQASPNISGNDCCIKFLSMTLAVQV